MDEQCEEPCVIGRLMEIDSHWTQQPTEKYRVLSDKYIEQLRSVGMWDQRGNENRLSWMETDGDEKGFTHECKLSCFPYFDESSEYSPSTSNGGICVSLEENDTMNKKAVKGQHDSFRLIKSLQDYLSGNIGKPNTVDQERQLSRVNSMQSFRFRRRIYMDPNKEVAAHARHLKEKIKWSSSGPEDFTSTPLLFQRHLDHQMVPYNAPSYNFNDPCQRALQALKDSRNTSKVSKHDHISFVMSRTWKDHHTRQKSRSGIALSVSTSPYPIGQTDTVDQFASAVTDNRVNHQDSMHALPGIAFDTLLIPETLSPRSSEEACQHSPVSVLQSSSNAGVVPESDHFKHVNADLKDLRMHLKQLETEFPEGFSESSITPFSHKEDKQEEVRAQLSSLKHEAMEIMDFPRKELVIDSRWLDLTEEIGTELESLLIDELIKDFVGSLVSVTRNKND